MKSNDITVDLAGNWRLYAPTIPAGCKALGTVTKGSGESGALVQTQAGIYSMLNARVLSSIDQRKVRAALGVANDPGRPAELTGGKRVNVYLDAASLDRAAELGNGNVSEGIRIALAK